MSPQAFAGPAQVSVAGTDSGTFGGGQDLTSAQAKTVLAVLDGRASVATLTKPAKTSLGVVTVRAQIYADNNPANVYIPHTSVE